MILNRDGRSEMVSYHEVLNTERQRQLFSEKLSKILTGHQNDDITDIVFRAVDRARKYPDVRLDVVLDDAYKEWKND